MHENRLLYILYVGRTARFFVIDEKFLFIAKIYAVLSVVNDF